jgi:streptogramin lyase
VALPAEGGSVLVVDEVLWVATDAGSVRVDPASGDISSIVPDVFNLAFDGKRLWGGGEAGIVELDPSSADVLQRYPLEESAYYVAATPDAVWASDTLSSIVQRVDPSDGSTVASFAVPSMPKGTAIGEGALWVACDGAGSVLRIDLNTNEIVSKIAVGTGPHTFAIGDGYVWVTSRQAQTLSKIDAATDTVVAVVEGVAPSPAVGVAIGDGSIFVAYRGGIARVDPDRAVITDRIQFPGAEFYDMKVMDRTLWATSGATLFGFDLDVR